MHCFPFFRRFILNIIGYELEISGKWGDLRGGVGKERARNIENVESDEKNEQIIDALFSIKTNNNHKIINHCSIIKRIYDEKTQEYHFELDVNGIDTKKSFGKVQCVEKKCVLNF